MISLGNDEKNNAMTKPRMTKPLIVCARLNGWGGGVCAGRDRRERTARLWRDSDPDDAIGAAQGKQHRRTHQSR